MTGGGTVIIRRWVPAQMRLEDVATLTYTVTSLVSWVLDSPQPEGAVNRVTNTTAADFRNGLAVFRIVYSDGSRGVLNVSCDGPGGSVDPYEGVNATKGTVTFSHQEAPFPNIDAGRTVFVVVRQP